MNENRFESVPAVKLAQTSGPGAAFDIPGNCPEDPSYLFDFGARATAAIALGMVPGKDGDYFYHLPERLTEAERDVLFEGYAYAASLINAAGTNFVMTAAYASQHLVAVEILYAPGKHVEVGAA